MRIAEPHDEALEALLGHIRDSRGFDFTDYKRPSLTRRIRRRMDALGATTYAEYQERLDDGPDEFATLFDTILINVTSFFRDPETWAVLTGDVIPALLADDGDGPVRVWSAGCAAGEEAFSVAMLLCEALGPEQFRARVKIYATDVDSDALATGRGARYPLDALEALDPGLVERYFERDDTTARFRSDLRRTVIFGRHDLMRDPPISRLDLLLCRNTLMYFTAPAQHRILDHLRFALRPGGYLVLGRSEALAARAPGFTTHDLPQRIFRRDGSVAPIEAAGGLRAPTPAPAPAAREWPDMNIHDAGFRAVPIAQLLVDADGHLAAASQQARVLFGLAAADLGRPFRDLEVSFRPLELRSRIETATNERHSIVDRAVQGSGDDVRWFDVHVTPLMAPEGRVEGVSIAFIDASAAQRVQGELDRLRLALETAHHELQATVEEVETTNEELQSTNEELETTNEELQSTNEELETINDELRSTNEELETTNEELTARTDDLRGVNGFFEAVLTSVRSAVVVVDRDLHVEIWNRQAEEFWGLRFDEVRGANLLGLDIGLPLDQLVIPIRSVLAGDGPAGPVDIASVNRRGRAISVRVFASPLRDDKGPVVGAVITMDVEERAA